MGWFVLIFAALGIWFLISIGDIDAPYGGNEVGCGCFLIIILIIVSLPFLIYIGIHNGYDWCKPDAESKYYPIWKEAKQRRERIENGFIDEKQRKPIYITN